MKIVTMAGLALLTGCVTAMPAQQFYSEFPEATSTRFLTGGEAKLAEENGQCSVISEHVYNAPIRVSSHGDVRAGAEGVDSIVANDGGNAYQISDFSWLPVGDGSGATQLRVAFDTLWCD